VIGFGNSTLIGLPLSGLNLVILAAATLCSYFAHDTTHAGAFTPQDESTRQGQASHRRKVQENSDRTTTKTAPDSATDPGNHPLLP